MQLPSGEITKVDPEYLITKSIHGTPKDCISQISNLINAGVEHFILFFWDFPSKEGLNLFSNYVMPKLRNSSYGK